MKKNNKNRITMCFIATSLLLSLVACGKEDTVTSVAEENVSAGITSTEEPTEEVAPDATYVEVNELNYEENTKVTSKGILYVGEDISTLKVIDVDLELTNVVVEDAEDGTKTVTIEQSVEGYIWTDGNTFATNLHMPVLRLADAYSGVMIPVGDEDAVETELKWKDNTYTVSAVETISWDDDDWNDGWYLDPSGDGERLNSRLIVKRVVTINGDYDGLVLVLAPITDVKSVDGDYIMDIWIEDSRLFNINDMNAIFVAKAEAVEETETYETEVAESAEETVKEETKTEETKLAETTATTAPKEDHAHSYTSTDTPSSCTVAGVRTYTCSCGDSYTENLGTSAHDYSVPITESVYHEEVWTTVERQLPTQKVLWCGCGEEFTSNDEFEAHRVANVEAYGPFIDCAGAYIIYTKPGETVYDRVKVSDAYTSEEIVGYKCSVCGQQK